MPAMSFAQGDDDKKSANEPTASERTPRRALPQWVVHEPDDGLRLSLAGILMPGVPPLSLFVALSLLAPLSSR
jgi:hypothetical protein